MKTQTQRDLRTIVDQNFFTKVTFTIDHHTKVTGRLLDISDHGFCITIKDITGNIEVGSEGILTLEKLGKVTSISTSIRWIDPLESYLRCMGLMSEINLLNTELKNYIR